MTEYLKYCLERFDENLNRSDLDDNIKSDISYRKRVIEDLLEKCSFQEKSNDDRQTIRIEWLASWKKRDKDISAKIATLDLYDEINSFIPYLKIVNRHGSNIDFGNLLKKELQLIDYGFLNYETNHISESEFNVCYEKFSKSLDGEILVLELKAKGEKLRNAFKRVFSLNKSL
jgi:hypothetical protein